MIVEIVSHTGLPTCFSVTPFHVANIKQLHTAGYYTDEQIAALDRIVEAVCAKREPDYSDILALRKEAPFVP